MTMILIFVIGYVAASAWDVGRTNKLLDAMVNPGRPKSNPLPAVTPAPRLVVRAPVNDEREA